MLIFIFGFLKNNPLQEYHAANYGLTQLQANAWIKLLTKLIYKTLDKIDQLPSRNDKTLELELHTGSIKNLRILDASGKLVKQSSFAGETYNLDATEWVPGVYFLQVAVEEKLITKKFVKQ